MLAVQASAQGPIPCVNHRRAPKLALPKPLAALLASSAVASSAGAEPVPYGVGAASTARAASTIQGSVPDVSLPSLPSMPALDMPDVGGLLDGVDPLIVGGVVAAIALPAALISLIGGAGGAGPKVKGVPAAKALEALAADEYCILLDVRSKADVKAEGSPNLRGVSRRGVVSIPFTSLVKDEVVVDEKFGSKVAKLKGVEAGGAPVILLDSTGAEAAAAARAILSEVPLDKLYYVQGGAAAWQAAGAPWKEPASFSFGLPPLDLSGISGARNTLAGGVQNLKEAPPSTKGLLAAAGVLGASALLFSQVELLLEVAGLVAVGQFLLKVVFAEDREKTLTTIKRVAKDIDVKDLPEDLSKIASTAVTLLDDTTDKTPTVTKQAAVTPAAEISNTAFESAPVGVSAASSGSTASSGSDSSPDSGL